MKYVAYKRFKENAICGPVNIPAKTECELVGNMITYQGKYICYAKSENGHQYFTRDDDEQGMLRGKLIQQIKSTLSKKDTEYQSRWDKIWQDTICQQYKRSEHKDYWLWNHAFFIAPIEDLEHIANLLNVKTHIT